MEITLNNGKILTLDKDEVFQDPKAEATEWLREYKERSMMEPTVEAFDSAGIKATFPNGAEVILTVAGRFPCSLCGDGQCQHFHAALPHWNRFKWKTAENANCAWGNELLEDIGITPYVVRPDLVTKLTRWAPLGNGEEIAPGVRMWHTKHGKLFRFKGSEGHVYVGSDHPDGHTGCLVCRDGCGHVARALELEAHYANPHS